MKSIIHTLRMTAFAAVLTIRTEDPEMLAYVSIGLFAGLRRSELCALEWSEIDLQAQTIEVKGVKAKTRQRRIVSVSDALMAWLQFASKTARPVPIRNEDVCGERRKNLYSKSATRRMRSCEKPS